MKTFIPKLLGAVGAAIAFAMPAHAFNVSLDVVGQDLLVSLTGLPPPTINAYDVFVNYNPALFGDIMDIDLSNALGDLDPNFSGSDYLTNPGELEAFGVPTLPNVDLESLMKDPLLLFTVKFSAAADLSTAGFKLGSTVFGCAAPDPTGGNNPNYSVECKPGDVPEPASMALAGAALGALALLRRRRSGAQSA
jgi:MYXO-CTERM domain-containing protein